MVKSALEMMKLLVLLLYLLDFVLNERQQQEELIEAEEKEKEIDRSMN